MSIPQLSTGVSAASALPPVNQALEPSWVRHGSSTTKTEYQAALAFEESLVQEMSKSLAATTHSSQASGEGEGEGESAEGSEGQISSMLPQALAQSVISAGGLGLAAQLTHGLAGVSPGAAAAVSSAGGVTAPALSQPSTAEAHS